MKICPSYYLKMLLINLTCIILGLTACNENKTSHQNQTLEQNRKAGSAAESQVSKKTEMNFNCTGYILNDQKNGGADILTVDTVHFIDAFNIKNSKVDSIKVKINSKAEIIMQSLSHDSAGNFIFNEKINLHKFVELLNLKDYNRFKHKLYDLKISENEIVYVKERYIP